MKGPTQVTCIGEALVDFVSMESGVTLTEAAAFAKAAGGAPANVAVGLARLDVRTAFIGNVGNDAFGRFVVEELRRNKVDTSGVRLDPRHKTRLAFVSLTKSGERHFEFWEQHPADEWLSYRHLDVAQIARSRFVIISSFLLLKEPARSTALRLVRELHRRGCSICFDPNVRLSLWQSRSQAKKLLLNMIRFSTIVRMNEEEARFLTGEKSLHEASRALFALGPKLVLITLGARGCYFKSRSHSRRVRGYMVAVLDTTGCGDGFLAGLLRGLLERRTDVDELSNDDLKSICRFANAAGALTATKRGAIAALPTLRQVYQLMKSQPGKA